VGRDGLVVVDKPGGMTSHDVVARMRRLAHTRRVGHGGTLDPMATGVLVVGVERATRLLTYVSGSDKSYTATIRLGQATITDDAEGDVVSQVSAAGVTDEAVRAALRGFVGEIDQVPSAVSAIKVGGVRSYARVRKGEQVDLPSRRVTISRLEIGELRAGTAGSAMSGTASDSAMPGTSGTAMWGNPLSHSAAPSDGAGDGARVHTAEVDIVDVDIDVTCSSGTYIRAIARDLGTAIGVGGHLIALRRTAVGGFTLAEAATLEELQERDDPVTMPLAAAAARLFARRDADEMEATVLSHGGPLAPVGLTGPYAVFAPDGRVLAIVSERDGKARAEVVLAPAGPAEGS
jgi:tRNA pseudouridine55 synthase